MSTAAPLTLTARDGRPLAASLFVPAQENGVAVVVNSASAVPRPYYNAFAAFLAERGFTVLTYDYRGVGESRQGPLKREAGRMLDWGTLDQAAAFDWFAQNRPHLALTVVGHSAGGQILGLNDRAAAIRAAYLVAAPHGYWGNWPLHLRPLLLALWYGALPASVALLGYFAGSRMGLGDLPAGVARDWARWCTSPHYIGDEAGRPLRPFNDLVTAPLRQTSFTDDLIAPLGAATALLGLYPKAEIEHLHLRPADVGMRKTGHFGFFRRSAPPALWQGAADWLLEKAKPALRAAG